MGEGNGLAGWGGAGASTTRSRAPDSPPNTPPVPTCSSAQGLRSSWGSAQHVVVTASSSSGTGRLWDEGVRNGGGFCLSQGLRGSKNVCCVPPTHA